VRFGKFIALVAFVVVALFAVGCHRKAAPAASEEALPIITDASAGLLFTWIDERGEFHVEESIASVPSASRDLVRVLDPSRDPPSRDRIFLADVRAAGPDGHYPVRLAARDEFESVAVQRRGEHGTVLKPQQAASAAASAHGTGSAVVIYGASWCGPCHQAQAYLRERGIPFIYKDVETDPNAPREMQSKLAVAGMHAGSIPVIDVHGKILVGFDARALDRALAN